MNKIWKEQALKCGELVLTLVKNIDNALKFFDTRQEAPLLNELTIIETNVEKLKDQCNPSEWEKIESIKMAIEQAKFSLDHQFERPLKNMLFIIDLGVKFILKKDCKLLTT